MARSAPRATSSTSDDAEAALEVDRRAVVHELRHLVHRLADLPEARAEDEARLDRGDRQLVRSEIANASFSAAILPRT
jgi:hypothetical protein